IGGSLPGHFALSVPAGTVTGKAFSFVVTAQDAYNNFVPSYAGTVHFASSDGGATLPADIALSGGVGTFSATLQAAGNQTLAASDAANHISGTSAIIAARGLAVTSLTPTINGFVAQFNKAFDPAALNLFDTNGTFGADDAVLVSGNAVQTL